MRTDFIKAVSISTDLTAAVFLGIILVGYLHESKEMAEKTRYYRYSLWVCFSGLLIDAASYLIEGVFENNFPAGLINYLAFVVIDILVICFTGYIKSRLLEKNPDCKTRVPDLIVVLCVIDALIVTFGAMTGKLFTIEKGVYNDGPWNEFIVVIPMICFVMLEILILRQVKSLGVRETVVISLYILMPGVAGVLQVLNNAFEFGYAGSAIGLVFIYVMIQSRIIAHEKVKAEMYSSLSTIDVLTGIKNRRGYDEVLNGVGKDEIVGAVFCDANSLKETNDTLGHEAGDDLIKKVSSILKQTFPDGDVCRISGDEFVVIVKNALKKSFADRAKALVENIRTDGWIASLGYEVGIGGKIEELIKTAEEKMYEDKSNYYKTTGKERRK